MTIAENKAVVRELIESVYAGNMERIDVLVSPHFIDHGSRYLRQMLDRHGGDLTLALAAYNAGPDAVRRDRGVPPYKETQNYVGKIIRVYEQTREANE